ncbi:MAG: helix-turn-helix domain-containing protein [Pseudomonadota bacterium]
MRRLQDDGSAVQCAQELAAAARREKSGRVRSRMLALRHLMTGHGPNETAGLFLIGRSQLYYWMQRYRTEGLAGLRDRARPGAPSHLKPGDVAAFRLVIATRQCDSREDCACSCSAIQHVLREKFNARYSVAGVYALLLRLGLPRPRRPR